ncbi:MAG: hypothetical protein CMN75_02760 [Spirochaeta sp.]|nr:hypothetical protein [Spirochaeta sp.]
MRRPTCQFGILLLVWSSHATDPVRTLLAHARVSPTWITSIADTYALERRVDAVEAMEWPRDADLLCGRWELLATTQARGAGLLRAMRKDPTLGRVDVYQDIRRENSELRLDNIITIRRDDDGWRSAWTLLSPGTRSSLVLRHAAAVEGTRVRASLEGIEVDGTRVGEAPQTIAALPLPGIASEAGAFDNTYVDGALRIARSSGDVLRVFGRIS